MIEEISALDEIEAIAATEGVDLVVVGPAACRARWASPDRPTTRNW